MCKRTLRPESCPITLNYVGIWRSREGLLVYILTARYSAARSSINGWAHRVDQREGRAWCAHGSVEADEWLR
jgi:hypothetical protein